MTVSQLRKRALTKYRSHKLNSWIIGIVCGFFSSAIIALNFITPYLTLLTVPVLILPITFASFLMNESYNDGVDLTFGNFFNYFRLYFSTPFNTSFNTIRSFFKSFLIFLGATSIGALISFEIFKYQSGDAFIDLVESFNLEMMSVEIDIDAISALLDANDGLLLNYFMSFLTPSLFLSIFVFVFLISKESVNLMLRIVLPRSNPSFLHQTAKRAVHEHFGEFYRTFIGLNWPMFLLLIIGFVGGTFLVEFTSWDPFRAITTGTTFGFTLMAFYYPFFINNNMALYETMEPFFKRSSQEVVNELLHRIEAVADIDDEEKERFEKAMKEIGDPLRDDIEEKKEEEKEAKDKCDSDSPDQKE